jgi:hypothetical protein
MGCTNSLPLDVTTSIESSIHTQVEPYIGLAARATTPNAFGVSTKLVVNDLSGRFCRPTLKNARYDIILQNDQESAKRIQIIGQTHQMVLHDDSRKPIAACMWKPGFGYRYILYAFHPIQVGQQASTQKHNNRSLYQWAECSKRCMSSSYKLKIWNGTEYTKRYLVESIKPLFENFDKLLVRSFGIPACLFEQTKFFYGSESWNGTVAPGIDPYLMVYLIAIIINLNKHHRVDSTTGGGWGGGGGGAGCGGGGGCGGC